MSEIYTLHVNGEPCQVHDADAATIPADHPIVFIVTVKVTCEPSRMFRFADFVIGIHPFSDVRLVPPMSDRVSVAFGHVGNGQHGSAHAIRKCGGDQIGYAFWSSSVDGCRSECTHRS